MSFPKCPYCTSVYRPPDGFRGGDLLCPTCGLKIKVPLAKPSQTVPISSSVLRLECPTCKAIVEARSDEVGEKAPCPKCGQRLKIPSLKQSSTNQTILANWADLPPQVTPSPTAIQDHWPDQIDVEPVTHSEAFADLPLVATGPKQEHSSLGIASFIIAMLIGGLDLILGFIIVLSMARAVDHQNLMFTAASGGMSILCLNIISIPLCLVGVGLSVVALVAHRDRNHLFSWIGLFGNGAVIFLVLSASVCGAVMDAAKPNHQQRQNFNQFP